MKSAPAELHEKLNLETGRMTWLELERYFARGVVVCVSRELDLLDVAASMAMDDKAAVQQWLSAGALGKAGADDARRWQESQAEFWAIVIAPWVLVQEIRPEQ